MSRVIMLSLLAALGVSTFSSLPAARATKSVAPKPAPLTLECRRDNGDYGASAYSFKWQSSDLREHGNRIDLLYERCGLLHVNTYGGCENRVIDLGKKPLDRITREPRRGWQHESIQPVAGHSYLLRVAEEEVEITDTKEVRTLYKMFIKFRVRSVTKDAVSIEWQPLNAKQRWTQPRKTDGRPGTKGQCGGKHPAK